MQFPLPVRPSERGDWPAVWPLLQAMGQVDSRAGARRRFKEIVRDNRQFLPVALIDDRIAGYAWAHHGPLHLRAGRSTVRLNDLFVAPEWRRSGAAAGVLPSLAKAEKWLAVKGDVEYSFLWIMFTITGLANIEVLLHNEERAGK